MRARKINQKLFLGLHELEDYAYVLNGPALAVESNPFSAFLLPVSNVLQTEVHELSQYKNNGRF